MRQQRQERALQAKLPRLRPRLKSCRLSRAMGQQINRCDDTDQIGEIVVGQAAAGAEISWRPIVAAYLSLEAWSATE